ncbi:MAG: DUF4338 domain-containing protein [Cyclobacteriaceae bacterium]|nr:DUF4338 domain-containing protein [Cyclobacteriaceae bacterium]
MASSTYKINKLKDQIITTISKQGFYVNGEVVPVVNEKEGVRKIHQLSRKEQLLKHKVFLKSNLDKVMTYTILGKDLDPDKIDLELIEVMPNTLEETLYRWWNLVWWSMPYQRAYGRQMRFLIWDNYHMIPFGIIGLQSPVLKMSVRDKYLKIPKEELDVWVNRSMQAQRVGALPPYNGLLGGKLAALTLSANEIRKAYKEKYADAKTLLENRRLDSNLLFITTSSAYGRSSIYNRLKFKGKLVAEKLGYTKGFGTFHVPDSLFLEIKKFLQSEGINTETTFGNGPSKRIKLLYQAFSRLELPNYSQHQIQREYYLYSHVRNLENVIHKGKKAQYISRPFDELAQFWKERWCLPRSQRIDTWKEFDPALIFKEVKRL